jgi:transposase
MNTYSLVPDVLWEAIEPLLPREQPKPRGGRPRVPDRAALSGIVFALRTGCPWRLLPKELGCGSGTTCWRRLRDWQEAGVWERLHQTLLDWLGDEAAIGWDRSSIDSLSVRAKRGVRRSARTPSTAANPVPSTTWSSTASVSPWPSASRRPTPTTPPSSSRWSMPYHRSSDRVGDQAGLVSAQPSSTPTKPTTQRPCGVPSVRAGSPHALPDAGSTPANGSDSTAGSWNGRSPGCSAAAAWVCALSGGPRYSRDCCTWPAR